MQTDIIQTGYIVLKEQRLKREYSGRVWESKNISSRVLSAISIVKKNWVGKESHLGQVVVNKSEETCQTGQER